MRFVALARECLQESIFSTATSAPPKWAHSCLRSRPSSQGASGECSDESSITSACSRSHFSMIGIKSANREGASRVRCGPDFIYRTVRRSPMNIWGSRRNVQPRSGQNYSRGWKMRRNYSERRVRFLFKWSNLLCMICSLACSWPWEKQGFSKCNPQFSNDCPWALDSKDSNNSHRVCKPYRKLQMLKFDRSIVGYERNSRQEHVVSAVCTSYDCCFDDIIAHAFHCKTRSITESRRMNIS